MTCPIIRDTVNYLTDRIARRGCGPARLRRRRSKRSFEHIKLLRRNCISNSNRWLTAGGGLLILPPRLVRKDQSRPPVRP